ncbi:MAG: alpha/beta hydrolase [Fibrobacter sp.]|nr:alpha/beta hydrolase [Fibrobacter sp.]
MAVKLLVIKYGRYLCCVVVVFTILLLPACKKNKLTLTYEKHISIVNTNDTIYSILGKKPSGKNSDKLLVILQGSEQKSVKRLIGYGAEASMFGYDILLIEKFAFYNKDLYWQTNCFTRRVDDICAAVNDVAQNVYHDSLKNVLLFGGSEGGVLAPLVARRMPAVKQVIIMGAGGLPQAKEFEILLKKGFKWKPDFFSSNGITNLEELQNKFDEIRISTDTLQGWMGHSFKYWKMALDDTTSFHALSNITIPVLIISGTDDESSPVESTLFVKNQLKDHSNIKVVTLDGLNHAFTTVNGKNMMSQIYKDEIIPWCKDVGAF